MSQALLVLALFFAGVACTAQSLSPTVIGSAGGSGTAGSVSLDWTVGEFAVQTLEAGPNSLTQGFHQPAPLRLRLNIRALLQGPYDDVSDIMYDSLRTMGLIPLEEPYTALGWALSNGGGETIDPSVLTTIGDDAIVDWVVVELRDKNDNTVVTVRRAALLQRDGDIVELDGSSDLRLNAPTDDHFIAVFHRNHLGVLTLGAIPLSSTPITVDLTDGSTATHGTQAQVLQDGRYLLWCGDVTHDGVVKYTGELNDRDPILVAIGGTVPTNTTSGYLPEDVNMDGSVKYTGFRNDRDPILVTIGGTVPTNTRSEQMP